MFECVVDPQDAARRASLGSGSAHRNVAPDAPATEPAMHRDAVSRRTGHCIARLRILADNGHREAKIVHRIVVNLA
jgi:hypothetical protein